MCLGFGLGALGVEVGRWDGVGRGEGWLMWYDARVGRGVVCVTVSPQKLCLFPGAA